MARHKNKRFGCIKGTGVLGDIASSVVNTAIDLLPFEAHIPGYNYCGPGTRLAQRLARGDKGINPLDEACKIHDREYAKYSDSANRTRADKRLAETAWQRLKAGDSSLGERAAALAITTAMKTKTAIGGGSKRKKKTPKSKGKGLYLKPFVKKEGAGSTPKSSGKGLYLKPYAKKEGAGVKKRDVMKKNVVASKTVDQL